MSGTTPEKKTTSYLYIALHGAGHSQVVPISDGDAQSRHDGLYLEFRYDPRKGLKVFSTARPIDQNFQLILPISPLGSQVEFLRLEFRQDSRQQRTRIGAYLHPEMAELCLESWREEDRQEDERATRQTRGGLPV